MSDFPPPDPAHALQRDIYLQIVDDLRGMLPLPANDTPEALARRDRVAIAQAAALVPANPDEANLAAHAVAATAQATECLRLAVLHAADPARVVQIQAQAALMGREARGYRAALLRAQAARARREATPALCDSAAWTEHCVHGLMAQALDDIVPAPAEPAASPAPEPATVPPSATCIDLAPEAVPSPAPPPDPDPSPVTSDPAASGPLADDGIAEAEFYALHYPGRARLIRARGGYRDDCRFAPPEPAVVRAIVTGTSAALRALDASADLAA